MNGHRSLLVAVLVITLFVSALFWFSLPPANVYARSSSVRPMGSGSNAPEITFTSAFTVYLPLILNNFPPTNQCGPGQTIADPANDVSLAHIDGTSLSTVLNGQTLQATLQLRDVPSQLTFDRVGVPQYYVEYMWNINVDVDNNTQTGATTGSSKGVEYQLSARHWVSTPNSPTTKAIENGVQTNVWEHIPGTTGTFRTIANATLTVNAQADTMILSGDIPGITSGSRLFFYTYDYNPGGSLETDTSSCAATGQSSSQHQVPMLIQQKSNDTVQHWSVADEQ